MNLRIKESIFIQLFVYTILLTFQSAGAQDFFCDVPAAGVGRMPGQFAIGFDADYDFGSESYNSSTGFGGRAIWVQGIGISTKNEDGDYGFRIREGFGGEIFKSIGSNQYIGFQYLPIDFMFGSMGTYVGSSARLSYQVNNFQVGFEHGRQGLVFGFLNPVQDEKTGGSGLVILDVGFYRPGKRGFGIQYWPMLNMYSAFITVWKFN